MSNKLKILMDNGCKWSSQRFPSTVDSMCVIVELVEKDN